MNVTITYRRTSRLSMRIGKNGEVRVSAPYGYPKNRIMDFIEEKKQWIAEAQARTAECGKRRDDFYERLPIHDRQQFQEAVQRLKAIVTPLVERHSVGMGVKPAHITFNYARTRWGSCRKSTGHINFSVYLLLLPEWCIEHVVVHEMAHLIEANHSPRFHQIVEQHFPRWREAHAETKRLANGH